VVYTKTSGVEWLVQIDFERVIPYVFGALFALSFGFAIIGSIRRSRRIRDNLGRLGSEMNLPLVEPGKKSTFSAREAALEGSLRGRSIRIYSYTTGSGKNRSHWCAVQVAAENNRNLSITVSQENMFTKLGEKLGFDQATVGDDAFDRQFYIKCNDEEFLRAGLIPEVRSGFVSAWKQGARGKVTVEGGWVKYAELGSFSDDRVCSLIPAISGLLCDVGEIVETHSRLG
jgi:hypothetical protein